MPGVISTDRTPETEVAGGGRNGLGRLDWALREPARARFLFVVRCERTARLVRAFDAAEARRLGRSEGEQVTAVRRLPPEGEPGVIAVLANELSDTEPVGR